MHSPIGEPLPARRGGRRQIVRTWPDLSGPFDRPSGVRPSAAPQTVDVAAPGRGTPARQSGMTRLVTERLLLRDFAWSDQEAVHAFAADPVVTRFMDWGPNDVQATRAFLAMTVPQQTHWPRSEFELAAVLRDPACPDAGRLIGSVSVRITNREHRQGELGYVFNAAFWSRGYATEATTALLEFGFGPLELHRIIATCHPDNRGSVRVLEKAGMAYEGRLRDHKLIRGQWRDSLLYAAVKPQDSGQRTRPVPDGGDAR
jgi:[ribosomal protein S5]-alanine N-acetyltransferase